jgi:hypothetical protein
MMKRDDTDKKAKHLRRLISVKNLVEYDGRLAVNYNNKLT